MVKDGEDCHGLQTTNLKNLQLAFQDAERSPFFQTEREFSCALLEASSDRAISCKESVKYFERNLVIVK